MSTSNYHLRFPIGEFQKPEIITGQHISEWTKSIRAFPNNLEETVKDLDNVSKDWIYRPEGWSIKQVVHHCADSHMNSFIRFKLSLTEESPTIRPYYEDRWADLTDGQEYDLKPSVNLLKSLHQRWVVLINSLTEQELKKEFIHPEHGSRFSLAETVGTYAWHGEHHLAHIHQAIEKRGS